MKTSIVPGDIRYMVLFEDDSLKVPLVRTLRFLSSEESENGVELLLFSELSAFGEPHKTFVRAADEQDLLDGEGLIHTLEGCVTGTLASDK